MIYHDLPLFFWSDLGSKWLSRAQSKRVMHNPLGNAVKRDRGQDMPKVP